MRHNMQHAIENPIKQYKIYFFLIVRNKKIWKWNIKYWEVFLIRYQTSNQTVSKKVLLLKRIHIVLT
jgi:hypothetical protein